MNKLAIFFSHLKYFLIQASIVKSFLVLEFKNQMRALDPSLQKKWTYKRDTNFACNFREFVDPRSIHSSHEPLFYPVIL